MSWDGTSGGGWGAARTGTTVSIPVSGDAASNTVDASERARTGDPYRDSLIDAMNTLSAELHDLLMQRDELLAAGLIELDADGEIVLVAPDA